MNRTLEKKRGKKDFKIFTSCLYEYVNLRDFSFIRRVSVEHEVPVCSTCSSSDINTEREELYSFLASVN